MANFYFEGVDSLVREFENLGKSADDIAFKAVDESAEIMDAALKKEIRKRTKKYGTGVLAGSIHHNKPLKNEFGIFTTSTARGRDAKKGKYAKKSHAAYSSKSGKYVGHRESYGRGAIRNQDKLFYLEYGTSKQAARPFIGETVRAVEPKVLNKMQEVFDREVEKLDNL